MKSLGNSSCEKGASTIGSNKIAKKVDVSEECIYTHIRTLLNKDKSPLINIWSCKQ